MTPENTIPGSAGYGQNAAALAGAGHAVWAVEPTAELRREGQQRHAALPITWLDDHLPQLPGVRALGRRFDLILLTAVWMHLDAGEREQAMQALTALLAVDGQIIMTLRHGPVPPQRRMFDVSAAETIALAAGHGLACHHQGTRADMLGRGDVHWSLLALRPA